MITLLYAILNCRRIATDMLKGWVLQLLEKAGKWIVIRPSRRGQEGRGRGGQETDQEKAVQQINDYTNTEELVNDLDQVCSKDTTKI